VGAANIRRLSGYTLHEIPPNGQGWLHSSRLGILEHANIGEYSVDSADSLHLQIEAMKLGFADVQRYLADPRHMELAAEVSFPLNICRSVRN
jgi:gamma-glutamyltranspeptidase/glutathione hydrolase